MPVGIVENMDILHQLAKEFSLPDNYDWFSDSKENVQTFFAMKYVRDYTLRVSPRYLF